MGRTLLSVLTIVMIGMCIMPGKAMAHSGYSLGDRPVAVAHDGYDVSLPENSASNPHQPPIVVASIAQDDSSNRCPGGDCCCSQLCSGTSAAIGATVIVIAPSFHKTVFSPRPTQPPVQSVCGGQFRPPESFN